ncbi:MAG: sensor histidine kinase [Bacteroidota bacterium]
MKIEKDSLDQIPLEDTLRVEKFIDGNAFSNDEKFELWKYQNAKARDNFHPEVLFYYPRFIASMPASLSALEKVKIYARYSGFMTNIYQLDTALYYAYEAEDIAENENDDFMRGKANHALGWYYAANCDYERAHRSYDKAIQSFETVNFQRGIRNTKVKKAIALQLQGYLEQSLKIYQEVYYSTERKPTLNDLSLLIKSTFKNKEFAQAGILLDTYFQRIEDSDANLYQYYHMRSIEANINTNDSLELMYLNKALNVAQRTKMPKENFTMLINLGAYYLERNALAKAKTHFKQATTIAYTHLMHNRFIEPYVYLLQIAEMEGNAQERAEYQAIQQNHANVIAQKISVSNTIENNQKSILLRQKKEIQSQNQKIWILTALGFIGFGLLLFSFFYFRKYKKIVEDLSIKNNLLDRAVNEKQTLLQETHHRVKNNLQIIASLLNLQRKYTKDKKLTTALIDGRNRVKSMALIHQLLYQKKELKGINIRSYVENLMSSLFSSLKANAERVQFINNVEPLNLHEDTLLAIGLIINEIVTNSLKYAFHDSDEGNICISLEKKEAKLFLSVSDDGSGMPDDFDINDKSSFGYSLITSLSKKLDAEITIENRIGTTVRLEILKFIEIGPVQA